MENEIFVNIIREHTIEVNAIQKEGKKGKKKLERRKRRIENYKRKHTKRQ